MPTKLRPTDILISLLIESLLVFISLVPFGGGDNPWDFAKPFAIMLAASVVLFVSFQFLFKWDSFILHFIGAFGVFVLGVVTGLPIILSFITAMLLFWRLTDAFNGNTLTYLWIIYIVSASIAFLNMLVLGLLNMDFPHRSWFIILFLVETFLTVLLHFLQVAKNNQFGKKMLTSYSMTFGGIILVAVIFAGVGPFISKILRFLLEVVGIIVFYVVQFFMSNVFHSPDFESIWKDMQKGNQKAKDPQKLHDMATQTATHHYTLAGLAFVIIVGVIVFFYLRRKWDRDGKRKARQDLHRQAFNGEFKQSIGLGGRKAKIKATKGSRPIRALSITKKIA